MVKPITGKCTINYCQYQEDVGRVCMLNDWISLLKGKGRSEQWEVYLYGDKTTKVDRDSAEGLPRGVPPPGTCGVDFGSSPNLATDHTIYELCLPSDCETRILSGENPFVWYRLRVVRRPGVLFGTIYRRLDGSDWVQVRSAIKLSHVQSEGMKIDLGLKQGTSAGEFRFRNLVVFGGEPATACFEFFKLIEGLVLRIEPRNCMF